MSDSSHRFAVFSLKRAVGAAVLGFVLTFFAAATVQAAGLAQGEGHSEVTYQTTDGVTLNGNWYGKGGTVVVLAHMRPDTQKDWTFFAEKLAAKGYRAFTFDFRGYGESGGGKNYRAVVADLKAALAYVRAEGASKIVVIGGSMGAIAGAKAAHDDPSLKATVLMAAYYDNRNLFRRDARRGGGDHRADLVHHRRQRQFGARDPRHVRPRHHARQAAQGVLRRHPRTPPAQGRAWGGMRKAGLRFPRRPRSGRRVSLRTVGKTPG